MDSNKLYSHSDDDKVFMFADTSDNGEEEDIELPTLVHYDGYDYTQQFTIIDDETSEGNVFINYNFGSGCR